QRLEEPVLFEEPVVLRVAYERKVRVQNEREIAFGFRHAWLCTERVRSRRREGHTAINASLVPFVDILRFSRCGSFLVLRTVPGPARAGGRAVRRRYDRLLTPPGQAKCCSGAGGAVPGLPIEPAQAKRRAGVMKPPARRYICAKSASGIHQRSSTRVA